MPEPENSTSVQRFSTFHDASVNALKAWHRPYCELLLPFGLTLDVGCGPGYFAEVLKELGGDAIGIDIDPDMVALAAARGNSATLGDHRSVGEHAGTLGAIHVSHVVEHMWGDDLQELLRLSSNALRGGGVLVIRTPNWQNKSVRHHFFWMDHTHRRPYPHELLTRMAKEFGLQTVHAGHEPLGLNDVYFIAQKPGGAMPPAAPKWVVPPPSFRDRLRRVKRRIIEGS